MESHELKQLKILQKKTIKISKKLRLLHFKPMFWITLGL